jgi:hypothetical protein
MFGLSHVNHMIEGASHHRYQRTLSKDEPYLEDQSLRFRIDERVCLAQNAEDCVPQITRQEASSLQLPCSQNDG